MSLAFLAFVAGVLTILAPCVLPLLPVVIGGSLTGKSWWSPLLVVSSFLCSMILVTIGLKLTVDQVSFSPDFLKYFSGIVFFLFGLTLIAPSLWGKISSKASLQTHSMGLLHRFLLSKSMVGLIFLGIVLVPVFVSCSPTYILILGVILPQQFWIGIWYLFLYLLGIALVLFAIGVLGQRFSLAFERLAAPHGLFKKMVGVVLIIFSILVITGYQTTLETWILDMGWIGITDFEFEAVDQFKDR